MTEPPENEERGPQGRRKAKDLKNGKITFVNGRNKQLNHVDSDYDSGGDDGQPDVKKLGFGDHVQELLNNCDKVANLDDPSNQ